MKPPKTNRPDPPASEAGLPDDIAPREPLIELPGCDWDAVHALENGLNLHPLAAQTLVRRGVTNEVAARAWIGAGRVNPPEMLPGAVVAAEEIVRHIGLGSRIAVHGDYDVDGVCSTAILVRALAGLGADVTWHVPSRFDDGYGLTRASVERLASAGAELIIAVDCGVGSTAEVALARQLGVAVVVCDHHAIGERLPDCPVVHPGLGGYPDPELCAAATAHKLASLVVAGAGGEGETLAEDLALVGLATVCDLMPLTGENRALVQQGVAAMRATQRPGLRELMRVAGTDQLGLDAGAFGFALGPRINAAGRMHSAEPAVELLLTASDERATELANGLATANRRRREIEQETLREAELQARTQRDRYAIVVAGEGWHPGVLGIVAGRLAESYRRPAIVLALEAGIAAGSGRSGGRYDLLDGLTHCAGLLNRFGGHRAAAGLELDEQRLGQMRTDLDAHARQHLTEDDLRRQLVVDAVGRPADISLDAVAALESLGPFGAGNPSPRVLIAGAQLVSVAGLGRGGGHFKLGIAGEGARASVVAFRQERAIVDSGLPRTVDLVVELQRNLYNGREEAQAVLRGMIDRAVDPGALWREEFERALGDSPPERRHPAAQQQLIDRRGRALAALVVEYQSRARRLAIACNDPLPLRRVLEGALAASGANDTEILGYDDPRLASGGFDHVLLAEPPPAEELASFGDAVTIAAWGEKALADTVERAADLLLSREHTVVAYRAVRESDGSLEGLIEPLRAALPDARVAGRAVRALAEIEVLRIEGSSQSVDSVVALETGRKDLDQSFTFRSYSEYREESERWLRQLKAEQTSS